MEPDAGKSTTTSDESALSCCVCFNNFEASGDRTKMHAFECGRLRHATCLACDRTLWHRWDDTCPTCRAPRDVVAGHRLHGQRQIVPGGGGNLLFGGWGGTAAAAIFFPTDTSGFDSASAFEAVDLASAHDFVRARETRVARMRPPDPTRFFDAHFATILDDDVATRDDPVGDDAVAATIVEETIEAIRRDDTLQAALSALRNIASIDLSQFGRLVGRRNSAGIGRAAPRRAGARRVQMNH